MTCPHCGSRCQKHFWVDIGDADEAELDGLEDWEWLCPQCDWREPHLVPRAPEDQ